MSYFMKHGQHYSTRHKVGIPVYSILYDVPTAEMNRELRIIQTWAEWGATKTLSQKQLEQQQNPLPFKSEDTIVCIKTKKSTKQRLLSTEKYYYIK